MHSFSEESRRRLRQQHCAMGYTAHDAALVVDLACSAYERALEVTHSVASLAPEPRVMVASYHLAVQLLADSFGRLAAIITSEAEKMDAPISHHEVEITL